ncbi:TIGR03668 family PPOX class F420-dependent oxidoreductase [Streptomyces xiamenensis]|uniref:TIGR03668 family PPOX class F420-dependent oxidoreductase n=1 Tax=Streptomyces xiamenensis TaxID=408015 RepID=UPI003D735F64
MKLGLEESRQRLTQSRVARLATADTDGLPHVVPITFAVNDDYLFFAIDHKPKTTWNLRRLRNIRDNPRVAVLADHFESDWENLWWVRADGKATVYQGESDRLHGIELLKQKYSQYVETPPRGPVVAVKVDHWSGWAASG